MGKNDKLISERSFAKYQIDDQAPLGYFTIVFLTSLHVLRLLALKRNSTTAADKFPAVFTPSRSDWAPDALHQYFRMDKPTNLKAYARPAQRALTRLLHDASAAFIDDLEALGIAFSSLPADSPLCYVVRVRDLTTADAELDAELFRAIVKHDTDIPAKHQVSSDEKEPLDVGAPRFRQHFMDEFSKFVSAAQRAVDPGGDGYAPGLPGIPVDSPALLKARHWGRKRLRPDPDRGLYYVIRQARGWRTGDQPKVDIIVRDLLWLRPTTESLEGTGIRDPYEDAEQHGARLGYYFSSIDGQVFEITSTVKRGGIIMLDAVAPLDHGLTKSLCLYFPAIRAGSRFSLGNMVGSVEDNRTGAWTVVCMRTDLPEDDRRLLELELSIYSDSYRRIDRTPDYDGNTVRLNRWIEEKALTGVLYSRHWFDQTGGEVKSKLEKRKSAFSSLFDSWREYEADMKHVDELLDRIGAPHAIDPERLRRELLSIIQDEERHALTPPIPSRRSEPGASQANLSVLCDKQHLPSYHEYSEASHAGVLADLPVTKPSVRGSV